MSTSFRPSTLTTTPSSKCRTRSTTLTRGLAILRVFRPGVTWRGNSEIADLTGLSPSTVSRLAQTLVDTGFLEYDRITKTYRLGAPVLGLAEAYIAGSQILSVAIPLMENASTRLNVNVSLAVADGEEMVYLHSVRRSGSEGLRRVSSGHRVPMAVTSLGRAYIGALSIQERMVLLARIQNKYPSQWRTWESEICDAADQVQRKGYCQSSCWLPGINAIAKAIRMSGQMYAICLAFPSDAITAQRVRDEMAPALMTLTGQLQHRTNVGTSSCESRGETGRRPRTMAAKTVTSVASQTDEYRSRSMLERLVN